MENDTETYLGDAVYASFDGQQICLRTGDGNNQRIYLEPEVLKALQDFVAKIRGRSSSPAQPRPPAEASAAGE